MDDDHKRLGFAAQLALCVHRALGGQEHNPCCIFYSVDNPGGITEPVKVCGCEWPKWAVRG